MGWSQTEPTTPVKGLTAYNHLFFGDQAQRRLDRYNKLEKQVKTMRARVPDSQKNAYYELIEYPIVGASLMNKKILYRDKARLYAEQGRLSARQYATLSKQAYQDIVKETDYYNNGLAGGKWNGMMSMAPRELPVYELPNSQFSQRLVNQDWHAVPEGYSKPDSTKNSSMALPEFNRWNKQAYFIDVYLCQQTNISVQVTTSANWIKVSQTQIALSVSEGSSDSRIWVEIDWAKAPKQFLTGLVRLEGGGQSISVAITANNAARPELDQYTGFIGAAGFIAINATSASARTEEKEAKWGEIDGLGYAGRALEALPLRVQSTTHLADTSLIRKNPSVTYNFYTFHPSSADVSVFTLPTFPLTSEQQMRYAVSIDGGNVHVLNFKTVGRTDEWKQNVLSNNAVRTLNQVSLPAGKHTLTIYTIDPGVILDRIYINLGNKQPSYGLIPETVHSVLR